MTSLSDTIRARIAELKAEREKAREQASLRDAAYAGGIYELEQLLAALAPAATHDDAPAE